MAHVPTALPFAFDFDPAHTAIVLIDMQRDFLEPGGFGATLGNDVNLRDVEPMGRILIRGEPGAELTPSLAALPYEIVIDKPGKGAFYATALDDTLQARGITHLILGGVTTEVCVQSTMREANDRGYVCLLAEDATASYFPEFKAAVLEMVRAQGAIVGWTARVSELAAALQVEPTPAT